MDFARKTWFPTHCEPHKCCKFAKNLNYDWFVEWEKTVNISKIRAENGDLKLEETSNENRIIKLQTQQLRSFNVDAPQHAKIALRSNNVRLSFPTQI